MEIILYFFIVLFIILLVGPMIGLGGMLLRDLLNRKYYTLKRKYKKINKQAKPKTKKVWLNTKLTKRQKDWIGFIYNRVANTPNFDFIEKTFTVDSYAKEHLIEYIRNEPNVPEDKRKEVASKRVEGLISILDFINSNASKEQNFHYVSSLKGAIHYAGAIGINTDKYYDKKKKIWLVNFRE